MATSLNFSTDCPISLPVPPDRTRPILTEFIDDGGNKSGWGFTSGGICISLTAADREEIFSHTYMPSNPIEGH